MARVKIWAQSDYYFTNYNHLSEATVVNFQNNRKIWISCVDKALLSDRKKILFKQNSCLISVIRTLLYRKQRSRGGMLTLNVVVLTHDAERSGRTNSAVVPENTKNLHKLVLADRKLKLCEIAEQLKILEDSVFAIFALTFVNEKAVLKVGTAFAHSRSKTRRVDNSEHCLQLFQRNKKGVFT